MKKGLFTPLNRELKIHNEENEKSSAVFLSLIAFFQHKFCVDRGSNEFNTLIFEKKFWCTLLSLRWRHSINSQDINRIIIQIQEKNKEKKHNTHST